MQNVYPRYSTPNTHTPLSNLRWVIHREIAKEKCQIVWDFIKTFAICFLVGVYGKECPSAIMLMSHVTNNLNVLEIADCMQSEYHSNYHNTI